jgi:hypothetical protein
LGLARASTARLVEETLNGVSAFVVPGADPYSFQQGVWTTEPGGVEASGAGPLLSALDAAVPFVPSFSATVAAILNDTAQQVQPGVNGPFQSAFANLAFPRKGLVFSILEGVEPLKGLVGVLPALAAFLAYSEVRVFDPETRALAGRPVGWTLTGYEGTADGRDAFKGYFQHRRVAAR